MKSIQNNNLFGTFNACVEKYRSLENLRKLAKILSLCNINAFLSFALWYMEYEPKTLFWIYLIVSVGILYAVGILFIRASFHYEGTPWVLCSWLCLIFISPLGLYLAYYCFNSAYWVIDNKNLKTKQTSLNMGKLLHSATHKLEKRWKKSFTHLNSLDKETFDKFQANVLGGLGKFFEELSVFQVSTVISMCLIMKQFKQKTFENVLWQPQWYENNRFTFAIKNIKPITTKNKYPMSIGVIVLDEINNYKSILDKKVEIKSNLKFSPAKMICLCWGNEYKVYVNE